MFKCNRHSFIVLGCLENLRGFNKILAHRDWGIPRKRETGSNCAGATRTSRLKPGSPATPLSSFIAETGSNCRHRRRPHPRLSFGVRLSRVSIMTEGWLLWMNGRSIRGAPRCVFSEPERQDRFCQEWRSCFRRSEGWRGDLRRRQSRGVTLSNIGA